MNLKIYTSDKDTLFYVNLHRNIDSLMIKSMTGYGKATATLPTGKLTIEIRTLNGKSADINIKSSLLPKDKDLLFRQIIASSLQRGTIDVFLTWESGEGNGAKTINAETAKAYMDQLRGILSKKGLSEEADAILLSSVLKLPEVVDTQKADVITDEDWPEIEKALNECLEKVNDYRSREGEILYKDVTSRVARILNYYEEVEAIEPQRVQAIREKILKASQELQIKLDKERYEQEMIFYLEKLDINEEKVRLRQHCRYFMETIDSEACPGKKLGFIIQEMGREINTTGSKANHAQIQALVVKMKDELEKMREQSMNIL